MPKIRVYTQTFNPFSAKVEVALALKKLPYEREVSNDPDDAKRWSPVTQLLPVIDIDGRRIHDSATILKTIEELFPEPPLLAPEPKTARLQERLAEWADSSFLFYWNRWREARFPRPGDEQPADNPTLLGKLRAGILHTFGGGENNLTRGKLREAEVLHGIDARLADLIAFLGQRDFFYADQPSFADISVVGMLRLLHDGPMPGAKDLIEDRAELVAYMKRMDQQTREGIRYPPLELPPA